MIRLASPRLARRELPLDRCAGLIARGDPGVDQSGRGGDVRSAPVQALARHRGELDFSHVQPASMLGCVMEFELFQQDICLVGWGRVIERTRLVRVQIVHHHPDHLCVRIGLHEALHGLCKVDLGAPLGDPGFPLASRRFAKQHDIGNAAAHILDILPRWLAWLYGLGRTGVVNQLPWRLIEADDRPLPIIRGFIQMEHVFHGGDEIAAGLAFVAQQQNSRPRQFARRVFPLAQHRMQLFAFRVRQNNPILHHDRAPVKNY